MAAAEDKIVEDQPISEVEPENQETQSTEPEEQRVPLHKHVELRRRAQEAERLAAEREREIEALKNENDLQSLAIKEPEVSADDEFIPIPDRYDYDDDAQWLEAQKDWNRKNTERLTKQAEELAAEKAKSIFQQQEEERQKTEAQKQAEQEYNSKYKEMLDRADKLNVDADEFVKREDALKTSWSPWFFQEMVKQVDNPEMLVMELGKDPDKALELAQGFDANMYSGLKAIIDFAGSLDPTQSRGDLPEPDTPVEGGAGAVSSYDKKLHEMREKCRHGKIPFDEFWTWKQKNKPSESAA